jgi:hypothetical protein
MATRVSEVADTRCYVVTDDATVAGSLAVSPGEGSVVIVGRDRTPLSVVEDETLKKLPGSMSMREVAARQPSIAVVDAKSPLREVAASPAIKFLDEASGAVVVMQGEQIVGVWTGPSLENARLRAAIRGVRALDSVPSDASLPGSIRIPAIVRLCSYQAMGRRCLARAEFAELPNEPPPCTDPEGLGPHRFGL